MKAIVTTMNRFKRALGLPESISVLGMTRACPVLVFLGLVVVGALAVMALG